MNIRKEYPKVCLFLWILGMCFHAHPILAQSVIPVPLKMEQGTGCFLLSENTKTLYKLAGFRSAASGKLLASIAGSFEKGKKKDTQNILSLLITEKNHQLPSPESYTLSVTPHKS